MTFEQKSLTRDEVLRIMAGVVDEYGKDYVYRRPYGSLACLNWFEGKPSCLIGHVMYRWGIPEALLATVPSSSASGLIGTLRAGNPEIDIESDIVGVLLAAQEAQDDGESWGQALARARTYDSDYADL